MRQRYCVQWLWTIRRNMNVLNDCILCTKKFKVMDLRYKKKDDDSSSDVSTKDSPTKVLWYLLIISRFKRLFANTNDARKP
ncbi:hypothetical protein CR513_26477, partial [Mucuna pruriens]